MKFEFGVKKLSGEFVKLKKFLFVALWVGLLGLLVFSLFSVLTIKEDQTVVESFSSKKSLELNISFDKKSLQELDAKKSPAKVDEAGGRNPFLAF